MTLLNICNMINNINNQAEETSEVDEDDLITRQFPAALDGFSLEAMLTIYQLQKVCHSRVFQHWEVKQNVENVHHLTCIHPLFIFQMSLSKLRPLSIPHEHSQRLEHFVPNSSFLHMWFHFPSHFVGVLQQGSFPFSCPSGKAFSRIHRLIESDRPCSECFCCGLELVISRLLTCTIAYTPR